MKVKAKNVERTLAEEYRKRGDFYDKVNDLYQHWLLALKSGHSVKSVER